MSLKLKYHFSNENKPFALLPHITTNLIERLALNPQKILPHLTENIDNGMKNGFFEEIIFEDKEKSTLKNFLPLPFPLPKPKLSPNTN